MTMAGIKTCFFCDLKAAEVCKSCNLVAYCSTEHFVIHRPEDICFPFCVKSDPVVGRYLVASRNIKAAGKLMIHSVTAIRNDNIFGHFLELILYDQALALGPKMAGSSLVCLQCLKQLPDDHLYQCNQCKWPVCNEKCEKGKCHQRECEALSCLPDKDLPRQLDDYRCITPLRLILNQRRFPERKKLTEKLMDHEENRRKDLAMWSVYQKYVNDRLKHCQLGITDEEVNRVVGLLWTHSFACNDAGGQAIFPIFSIVSHSCIPNASPVVLNNASLALEAKIDIQEGEEVTISYLSVLQVNHFSTKH